MPKEYKVVVLGCGGVGKSTLTARFVTGQFVEEYDPTIEEFHRKEIDVDGNMEVIEILDTAGQNHEFARGPTLDLYIKNGEGFLLIYSIVDQQSFIDVQPLLDHIQRVKGVSSVPMLLVGNKCDLEKERVVATSDGEKVAAEWGIPFYETSALSKKNVDIVYTDVVREILKARSSKSEGGCCSIL